MTHPRVKAHYGVNKKLSRFDNFDTHRTLIYHGGCLENILEVKFTINGDLHPNISLFNKVEQI
jgi:hypothetical protein